MEKTKSDLQPGETHVPTKSYVRAPKLNYNTNISNSDKLVLHDDKTSEYEMATDTQDYELQHESPHSPGSSTPKRLRIAPTINTSQEEHWQQDKVPSDKTNKKKHITNNSSTANTNFAIPTSNRFALLSETNTQEQDTGNALQLHTPKPEPIFVTGVVNIQELKKVMDTILVNDKYTLTTMRSGHLVKLMPVDVDSYKIIRECFLQRNISHYTYQLKHERAYRVVLRGMHQSEDVTMIKDELNAIGHMVRNITNVLHRVTKEPLPLFFVDLEPAPNNKAVFDIKHINHTLVTFEPPYTKREIVQCKRCQRFGHTKNHCNRPFRCVKCGEDHPTITCHKRPEIPATCVNCENHPASYRGCKIYKEYKQKAYEPIREKLVRKQPVIQSATHDTPQNLQPSTSGRSYAEVARESSRWQKPQTSEQHTTSTNVLSAMEQMLSRFEKTLEKIIDKMMDRMFDLIKTIANAK